MSPSSPDRITLTGSQRRALARLVRAGRTEQRLVTRAEIVLAAAEGQSNARIAASLRVCEDTVRKWRHRWCAAPGVASLGDAQRSGRPPVFTAVQVAKVKAVACTPPADAGLPMSRWSCPELARHAVAGGICASISPATVRRWLSEDALKPWQYRSWIFITDPDFAAKATRVLDLYDRDLGRETAGRQRVRDLRRREDLHPGPLPLPSHPAAGQVPHDAGQPRLRPRRRGRLPGRLRRAPRHRCSAAASRPPASNRSPTGQPGHDHRTLRIRRSGVLDRRQRILPPRPSRDRPARRAVPERDHGAHPGARLLAEPDRDLLLHRATQSSLAQRLHRPRRGHRPPIRASRPATTRPPDRSNGSSPPPTSTTSWTGSTSINPRSGRNPPNPEPHDPRRTYERDH